MATKWTHTMEANALEKSFDLFSRLKNRAYGKILAGFLNKVSQYLGYSVVVEVPYDITPYLNNPEALRALRLLDKLRTAGLLESFYQTKHPFGDEPKGEMTLATLKKIKRFGFSGKGADMFDRASTLWPAVGEAVERYAMQFYYPTNGEYKDASWKTLSEPKVDIFNIAGFDDKLRTKPHPMFDLAYDENSKFRWITATELPSRRQVFAPLQWFSFSHIQNHVQRKPNSDVQQPHEPLLSVPITTGVAAGQNLTDATYRGLLEVIERDAFIIYWLNQIPAHQIDILSFGEERFKRLHEVAKRYHLEIHLLYLQTDTPAHTVCCMVVDRSGVGPALILGSKTGLFLSDTVYGALSDTLAHRGQYRLLMNSPASKKWASEFDGNLQSIGHKERMYYWFAKDKLVHLEKFISGQIVHSTDLPTYNQYTGKKDLDLETLLSWFKEKNYQVFYKELLDDNLKKLTEGLSVAMVRVPKMQPLYLEESLLSIQGDRLRDVPKFLNAKYQNQDGQRKFFTNVPHPFP